MTALVIWGAAIVAYGLFRLWYDNWHGPLTPAEIDNHLAAMADRMESTGNSAATLRSFLEADDGHEFVMLNLVKAEMAPVPDPEGGPDKPGFELLQRYAKNFMPVLLRNGGHPGIVGRKIGGYVDAWNTEADPGWTVFGLMRYRSRRDMMKLANDPAFLAGHPAKVAGTAATFSFPTQRMTSFYIGPRVSVALLLALIAALSQLMLTSF